MTTCKQCGYWDAITDDGLCPMCAQERPEPANTSKNAIIRQLKDSNHMLFRQLEVERRRGQETADVLSDIADENDALRQRVTELENGVDADGLIRIGFRAKPETFTEAEQALIATLAMQTAALIRPSHLAPDEIDTAHSRIDVTYDPSGRAERLTITLKAKLFYDELIQEPTADPS